ncbi:Outer membrane receptor proteins, mostly Fe transport [Filimonas lacunae]|uniref:Outer membrane receptor proteins, mostly Fe transport n=1 Tax=Filimonas lacunae TaxID=477680 RepID=A0A173M9N3_9BACT|nr:outer membrane beta-barrel family protein [Filimonas lacunae]BAV04232.1 TonB-dependent receptor [Filimonas lacunae]SIT13834.1 Outer membrane receptor proteins, mostly Fe transport [Filimonas lacunae]
MKLFTPILIALLLLPQIVVIAQQNQPAPDTLSGKTLDNLTVTASKSYMEVKTDKVVLNLAQSPLAAGQNMYEVLRNAPGLLEQGNFMYKGKIAAVYINGKPSRLSGEDLKTYLSGMPANTVEKIELIANPSAQFEASSAAVVNIILAKNKSLGTNASIIAGAGAGKYSRYNGGININNRSSRVNLYGSYNCQRTKASGGSESVRTLQAGTFINDNQYSVDNTNSHTFKAGIDYTPSTKHSFGILFRGTVSEQGLQQNNYAQQQYDHKQGNESFSYGNITRRNTWFTPALNVWYNLKTSAASSLNLSADYMQYARDKNAGFITHYLDEQQQEYMMAYQFRNEANELNRISSYAADYSNTIKGTRIEAGVKAIFTKTDNNFIQNLANGNTWKYDSTYSNHFIFNENVYAAYASASRSFGKLDVQAGLRAEHTYTKGYSLTLHTLNTKQYTNLFPNINLAYNLSEQQQFSFAYRRSIERFGFNIVNPFTIYLTPYSSYQGNPDIQPSFSHNYSVSWAYGNRFTADISYSNYQQVLAEVYRKAPGKEVMVSSFDNVPGARQVTVTLTYLQKAFNGKLTSSNSFMGIYAQYVAAATSGLNNAAYSAYLSSNNTLQLSPTWKAEVNLFYMAPITLGAAHIYSLFNSSVGVSHSFMNKRGNINLAVSDIFNTYKQRLTANSYGVNAYTRTLPETRFVTLSLTWRLGNQQVKAATSRRTNIEEVKSRMQ